MRHHRIFLLYMSALFFMGLGYLAIMPPFEGFDEYAHWSSMRQIADTGTIPILGKSYVDQAYKNYTGPRPYSHDLPPFDSGLTYAKFFDRPALVAQYRRAYRQESFSPSFRPGQQQNWQAQHPPLYYLLMAPVVRAVGSASLVTQLFVLRLVSFLFALGGVALGFLAVAPEDRSSMLGFFLYPLILPMFFPEFARLGNDSLCLLWAGLLTYLLSVWRRGEDSPSVALAIGVTLGLGLLTKALFLPIAAAMAVFLPLRLWQNKENTAARPRRVLNLLWMFYPAALIGGGWYSYTATHFGAIGGVDAAQLAHQGGMIAGLTKHFSIYGLAIGVISMLSSYLWAGTWSSVALPFGFRIPLFLFAIWVFGVSMRHLRRRSLTDMSWLPFWVFALFIAGLLYHLMIGLALDGRGQTPGWYLHILMPLVAPTLGVGLCTLLQNCRIKPVTIGVLLYAVCFQVIALWSQFALFTGCATKTNGGRYAFPNHAFCFDRISALADRLSVLGCPVLAAIGFGGASACALLLIAIWKGSDATA